MKKVILGLALATMIISCKETKTTETTTEEIREEPAMEPIEAVPDTVMTKTETTIDTTQMGGAVKKTEKTTKEVK